MIFADSHTHLYFDCYNEDIEDVIKRSIDAGVKYMVIPGVDKNTITGIDAVCEKFPKNCFPCIGLHPTDVANDFSEQLDIIEKNLDKKMNSDNKYYAIGECGVDLYHNKTYLLYQKEAFERQIEWAKKYDLPLVVHSRDAFEETVDVLQNNGYTESQLNGVFHCFSGNVEQAKHVIAMGFMIGIGGVVTFKNSSLRSVVENVSLEHILLETDAPFLAPAPYRGQRNESAYIPLIAAKIAEIKNVSIAEVAETTTKNTLQLFNIK